MNQKKHIDQIDLVKDIKIICKKESFEKKEKKLKMIKKNSFVFFFIKILYKMFLQLG